MRPGSGYPQYGRPGNRVDRPRRSRAALGGDHRAATLATPDAPTSQLASCHTPPASSGISLPSLVVPVTATSSLPIMKSTCVSLAFTRAMSRSATPKVEAAAERDVAGRVLIQQRVVEDRAKRPDATGAVDQGDLA